LFVVAVIALAVEWSLRGATDTGIRSAMSAASAIAAAVCSTSLRMLTFLAALASAA
jgi:hypothetical protein